ncbi:MAG TPA: hypothetical protein VK104_06650 [Burkholderiaceae bacterium]|nr:hypothetical protein [Burkholderiaceae bacterium]
MRAYSIFSTPRGLSDAARQKRRHMLARMGLAWLVMMQVTTLAFPGYLRSESMAPDNLALLDHAIGIMNWLSLFLSLPVMLYCAWPVWQGALGRMRHRQITMDVPVALGILVAFIPSAVATLAGQGQVYFESVSMFVAFLLTARYLELSARQSIGIGASHQVIESLRKQLSGHANRLAFWFVVGQLALAFAAGAVWWAYQPSQALGVMVALIVISCPCAMAMSVPTAMAAAHASISIQSQVAPADLTRLQHATRRVARQNLYGSIAWHLVVTPMAAIGWVAPWLAAITMLLSSLAVAVNAMRLYRQQGGGRPRTAWAASSPTGLEA